MLYQDKHVLPVALACYLQNFIQNLSSFSGGNLYVISGPICSSVKDCKAQHLRSYQWKKKADSDVSLLYHPSSLVQVKAESIIWFCLYEKEYI